MTNSNPSDLADRADLADAARRMDFWSSIPFWGVHVAAVVGVIVLGFSWKGVALAAALYYVRMFGITAGFHRYFSHRTFKTNRAVQFCFAVLCSTTTQKGILWWAAHHRAHHLNSDGPDDVHSVKQAGFYWAHIGWFLAYKHKSTDLSLVPDLARFPELHWFNRHDLLPTMLFALALYLIGGPFALVWGYFVSTTLLWHGTFTINSLSHVFGRRRYDTGDESRNSLALSLLTLGEGWHNNHHFYQRSTSQGFYWWEIDITYYGLRLMQALRLVSGVTRPPAHVRARTIRALAAEEAKVHAQAQAQAQAAAMALDEGVSPQRAVG